MTVVLRPLESLDDYRACERLQRHAWGFDDALDVIPQTQLVTAQKYGGLVLGAFEDDRLLGFCYGFLGRDRRGRLVHCSHMLAVQEEQRGSGLGRRLKWAQRGHVLEEGLELMVWTFDPLESVNACLNFEKLGGVSDEYLVNLYGETTSRLHAGTATDRLTVKWFLLSPRVEARARGADGGVVDALRADDIDAAWALEPGRAGVVEGPGEPRLDLEASRVRCEIPSSIQSVKEADRGAARAWRDASRAVFTGYLARGYFVRECVRTSTDPRRTVYLLERGTCEPAGLES